VEDHLDAVIPLLEFVTGDDPRLELVLVHVVGDGEVDQVDELGAVGQVIDDHDIGPSLSVQLLDQIAADKASTASYYDHGVCLAYVVAPCDCLLKLCIVGQFEIAEKFITGRKGIRPR
jgi:hypothetical protein